MLFFLGPLPCFVFPNTNECFFRNYRVLSSLEASKGFEVGLIAHAKVYNYHHQSTNLLTQHKFYY